MKLKKTLGFFDIYSIASGAMISSGIFILPALAFARTGPSVIFSYLLAGVAAILGVLNVIELVTAMPKAGGDYYYITRTLGPMLGTVSGTLSWAALGLKSAFAIFGLSQAGYMLLGIAPLWTALAMTVLFTILNMTGVELAARVEGFMVGALLILMAAFIITGFPSVERIRFSPMLSGGPGVMLSTAGFVFISFGGIINVVTVSEEVRNPKRNIPLAMLLSITTIVAIYILVMVVMVGTMDPKAISESSSPIADTAARTVGPLGFGAISIAALLAFLTTANAGILSASRYPLAMSRDKLIPRWIAFIGKKTGTPLVSVPLTGILVGTALILPLEHLVKAASSVVLTANIFAALAVLIIRSSRLPSYKPSFKAPFFPYIQIITLLIFGFLLVDIGLEAVEISGGLVGFGLLVYLVYGRRHWKQDYALLHLIERATNRKIAGNNLESELIAILHERENTAPDSVDQVLEEAAYYDIDEAVTIDVLFRKVADFEKNRFPETDLYTLFREREASGTTALTPFFAIPHIIIDRPSPFHVAAVRCREGVLFNDDRAAVKAIFFLIGTDDQRTLHLKVLASLAQIVQSADFERQWMEARGVQYLQSLLLSATRGRFN